LDGATIIEAMDLVASSTPFNRALVRDECATLFPDSESTP